MDPNSKKGKKISAKDFFGKAAPSEKKGGNQKAENKVLYHPDGTVKETVEMSGNIVYVKRVDPNKVEELRTAVAKKIASSKSEDRNTLDVLGLIAEELGWKPLKHSKKAVTKLVGDKYERVIVESWKLYCGKWFASVVLQTRTNGETAIQMDKATKAHYMQFLKDLKTVNEESIEAWNKGLAEAQAKRASNPKAKWYEENMEMFSLKNAFKQA